LTALRRCKKVDVQLTTTGDISVILSSFFYWRRLVQAGDESVLKMFPSSQKEGEKTDIGDLKFLLPKQSDRRNVNNTYQDYLLTFPRKDAIFISYEAGDLPTAATKGAAFDYDKLSKFLLSPLIDGQDYITYSVIFGAYPFSRDEEVVKEQKRAMVTFDPWKKPSYVYSWSSAYNFRGIMSSFGDLQMTVFGFKANATVPVTYDRTKEYLHQIELPLHPNQSSWYRQVSLDCTRQVLMCFNPIRRYSGIANLIRHSKTATATYLGSVSSEEGFLMNMLDVTRVATKQSVMLVDFSGSVERSEKGKIVPVFSPPTEEFDPPLVPVDFDGGGYDGENTASSTSVETSKVDSNIF